MRPLTLLNTLGRRLQPFSPLVDRKVGLYTCGPTVYNTVHIGNLRTFVFEDVLRRSLRHFGYSVTQIMNLTDVDDKTIRGALAAGVPLAEFTARYVEEFFADLKTLNVEPADLYPRATDHVPEMIALIERLKARGHTYESDGSVWFRISTFPGYGKLSGIDLSQARAGARVADDEYEKEDPKDFALWKAAKPGEPSWESPFGPGRPGWHVECSAMSMKYLGERFDIHTGAVDNIFPHHENEIAQSEAATGEPFVNFWLHGEHLIVDGEKMSKSKGNFYTLADVLGRRNDPWAVRYFLVSVPYRKKLNFTFEALAGMAAAVERLKDFRRRLGQIAEGGARTDNAFDAAARIAAFRESFDAGLADDLNTAQALAALFDLVRDVNNRIDREEIDSAGASACLAALAAADGVLGVLPLEPGILPAEVEAKIAERLRARQEKDFPRADAIRRELLSQGIVLEDTPKGTRWKRSGGGEPEGA
jgi:cysteinyl-tRNA synthetase